MACGPAAGSRHDVETRNRQGTAMRQPFRAHVMSRHEPYDGHIAFHGGTLPYRFQQASVMASTALAGQRYRRANDADVYREIGVAADLAVGQCNYREGAMAVCHGERIALDTVKRSSDVPLVGRAAPLSGEGLIQQPDVPGGIEPLRVQLDADSSRAHDDAPRRRAATSERCAHHS